MSVFTASLSRWLPLLLALGCLSWTHASAEESCEDLQTEQVSIPVDDVLRGQLFALASGSLRERREMAEQIAATGHQRASVILEALLDSRLLFDGELVLLRTSDGRSEDAASGESAESDAARVVAINNPLRNALRDLIAIADLAHPQPARRMAAAERMMRAPLSEAQIEMLDARMQEEEHPAVRDALATTIALGQLQHQDPAERIAALAVLRGSLLAPVRARIAPLVEQDADATVREHAEEALKSIEGRIALYRFSENLFFGLSLGSVLLLAALGLAITFGVMGVINMAHGELIMIGAYTTWFLQTLLPHNLTLALLLAIPMAFLVSGAVGVGMERGIIRFLYGRPLETLLATFGISLILQQAVRSIFSPLNQAVASPEWISGSLALNPVLSLTWNRIYVLLFALMVFAVLLLILKRTTLGLKVRAVSQNRSMARALGVRANWVDASTFGLGAGIAGVAGVALAQLSNVGPNMGQAYIIDSFMVVVFGGVGNIWGTFVGALGLGVMNKFLEPYAGAVLAKIIVLLFIILFIQYRPRGLFPQKGRSAES
ncbi:MAG: urea ABC transporter permease subunit UrtB [Thiohalomonadaceae bacterium]